MNRNLALDAFDVDGLFLAMKRRQQCFGTGQAPHLVGQINLIRFRQTLDARGKVDCLPEIIEPLVQRHRKTVPDVGTECAAAST
jgi:hypothetical protein